MAALRTNPRAEDEGSTSGSCEAPRGAGPAGAVLAVRAPVDGTVASVAAAVGARVRRGAVLVVLTAMKLEMEVAAPEDGEVCASPEDRFPL